MIITSTALISSATKYAALSSNQAGISNSDILGTANNVMSGLVSEILQAREEFLIYQEAVAVVSGTSNYRIPYRAINGILRHLWFEDGTGTRQRLWIKDASDIEEYNTTDKGRPYAFFVQGNFITLLPTPNLTGNLLFTYPFRPNALVEGVFTGTVASATTNSVTVTNAPSNFISNTLYDIIDHRSGSGIIYYDLSGTVSGNTITFTQNIPLVAAGNFVALAQQSPVPMIPEEGHSLLLEETVMRIEMQRGNTNRVKNSEALVQDARKGWDMMLATRIISKPHASGNGGAHRPSRPY